MTRLLPLLSMTLMLTLPAGLAAAQDEPDPQHRHGSPVSGLRDSVRDAGQQANDRVAEAQEQTQPADDPARPEPTPMPTHGQGQGHDDAAHADGDHDHAADGHSHADEAQADRHASPFSGIDTAVAVLHPTAGNDTHGSITFTQRGDQLHIAGTVHGLTPGQDHGFHVHEFGDVTADDGTATGGHYNPGGHDHALPHGQPRHAGDLGNITANEQGVATLDITVDNLSVAGTTNPVLGRGLIVHAQPDDGGQPTGNAGARIAQGVIGIAGPAAE
jgi:Cu-Zn family superoxide dismutase